MKKFIHVFEGEIVHRYEADKPMPFGGQWSEGESIEIDPLIDLNLAKLNGVDLDGDYIVIQGEAPVLSYVELRKMHYPDVFEYIDGIVKGDQAQIAAYIQKCKDVKAKFPKTAK